MRICFKVKTVLEGGFSFEPRARRLLHNFTHENIKVKQSETPIAFRQQWHNAVTPRFLQKAVV